MIKVFISQPMRDKTEEEIKAEYFQLKIRYDKLVAMLEKWDKGELNFEPTCPRFIYNRQISAMQMYLEVLEERAALEHVPLEA